MNTLIMANYRTPNSGNFIASLLELGIRLRQEGGEAVFLFPEHRDGGGYPWSRWLETEGFRVYLLKDGLPAEDVLAQLRTIVKEHEIRLIHSHFGLYHRILLKNGKNLGVKVLFHDHMDYVTDASLVKQRIRSLRNAAVYGLAGAGVISVMEKKHKAYFLCPRRWYIPNGLSLRRNVERELTRQERREILGIAPEDKLCLFLGWDMYRKGVDIAIKAVAKLREKDSAWKLGLVGFGEAPGEQSLQWMQAQSGIDPGSDWIRFFPSAEDMYSYHRAADVYLSASRAEAFSYGILEAISQNTPVTVSDIEGTAWSIAYDKTVPFATEDAASCADALARAYAMGDRESNREQMLQRYGIGQWCDRVLESYRIMLKK